MHPIVIGHRGASGYRPEHTRAAFELAIAQGADALEPDLVVSKDGVLVVRHENEISGTTDVADHPEFANRRTQKTIDGVSYEGWFTEDFTWDELSTLRARERLPAIRPGSSAYDDQFSLLRFVDLLALLAEPAAAAIELVAELKHATYFASIGLGLHELFAAELEQAGWTDPANADRLTVESFELGVLTQLREREIDATYIYLLEKTGAPFDTVARLGAKAPAYSESLTPAGLAELHDLVDGISVPKALVLNSDATGPSGLVEAAHAAGLLIFCWTLRPENQFLAKAHRTNAGKAEFGNWEDEFRQIVDTGVDGIFVDHPDLALRLRGIREAVTEDGLAVGGSA